MKSTEPASRSDSKCAKPAAILAIDLVKHSSRPPSEIRQIQRLLEDALQSAIAALKITDAFPKYTGDGYFFALLGDSSPRALDFLNVFIPEIKRRFAGTNQTFRAGLDFGFLHLRPNQVTGNLEHFDEAGVVAARLESAAAPNEVLCSETVYNLFSRLYPKMFEELSEPITTKDRTIRAFRICPIDYHELRQAVYNYLYSNSPSSPEKHPGHAVLIVDDEPSVALTFRMLIRRAFPDFIVEEACDGLEALARFEKRTFSLVITDIVMPHMDGFELTERLSALNPAPVVIGASGCVGYDDCRTRGFFAAGGFSFIEKPFSFKPVVDAIQLALLSRLPQVLKGLDVMCEDVGAVMWHLQTIASTVSFALQEAHAGEHIADSLIRHKIKHTLSELVRSIQPGSDFGNRVEKVSIQMNCFKRLARLNSLARKTTFCTFLKEYCSDIEKTYTAIRIGLQLDPLAEQAIAISRVETILALVVCELIDNAVAALARKGQIWIDICLLSSTAELRISCRDSGLGVAKEDCERIFEEGYSTKGTGRGLGLHLVGTAVIKFRGNVFYEGHEGSCFVVTLPLGE